VPSDYFASVYEMLTALTLSAMVPPSDAAQLIQPLDVLQNDGPTIFTTLFRSRQRVVIARQLVHSDSICECDPIGNSLLTVDRADPLRHGTTIRCCTTHTAA
jgi:hypothetical protein